MPKKKNGLKKKNQMMDGYMGGGMMPKAPMSSMYRKGGMLSYNKGGATEIGKESQSYKEYVKKMFDGGMTSPAMKKKNKFRDGGKIGEALGLKEKFQKKPKEASKPKLGPSKAKASAPKKAKKTRNFSNDVPDRMGKPTKSDIEAFKRMGVSKKEIDRMNNEGVLTVTTVGTKRKRPLDGERSRGRKFNRANARTKFSD